MSPRVVAEALIRAATKPDPDAADEYATAAALLRTSTPAAGAELLRILATEVAAARDADHVEQARRRRIVPTGDPAPATEHHPTAGQGPAQPQNAPRDTSTIPGPAERRTA